MTGALFDTSALSDIMRPPSKRPASVSRQFRDYLRTKAKVTLSQITCYEVTRGLLKKRALVQLQHFDEFCSRCELLPVTADVLRQAAKLWATGRQQGMIVDDGDLIVAATAITEGLPLITANPKHFAWIGGLSVINWRDSP